MTSVVAIILPNIGLWPSHSSLWWIDIFAGFCAMIFVRFYWQANTRQQNAQAGSIWSDKSN